MPKEKRKRLCPECARQEERQANECSQRESEAMRRGENYECECPLVECNHYPLKGNGMKITSDSHLDHGLTEAQIEFIKEKFAGRDCFFKEEITLPEELGMLSCGLYGPAMEDQPIPEHDVKYVIRGARTWGSRVVVRSGGPRPTNKLVVIAGPHKDEPCILYTAYGGPLAPREPTDPNIQSSEEREASEKFWAEHALLHDVADTATLYSTAAEAREAVLTERAAQAKQAEQAKLATEDPAVAMMDQSSD
jgi:hypothetical protein